jgi:hypothetical protein
MTRRRQQNKEYSICEIYDAGPFDSTKGCAFCRPLNSNFGPQDDRAQDDRACRLSRFRISSIHA